MRNRRITTSEVAITHNTDETAAIHEAMNLLAFDQYIHHDDVVVITPNLVQKKTAETGVVVGPESLRGIIRYVKAKAPKRIVVACGSGERETVEIMKSSGFEAIINEEKVEFVDLNHGPFVRIGLNHDRVPATSLNRLYHEMTLLISFTQLKMHEEATLSAAIKNIALSWPPAEEHGFPKKNLGIHQDLHNFIRAMAEQVPIDLSIVSANPAMIGTGPGKGVPRHTGLVLAGTDPVATDTLAARLIGFLPQAVRYLFDASMKEIGTSEIDCMYIKGMGLIEAEKAFSMAAYGEAVMVDNN